MVRDRQGLHVRLSLEQRSVIMKSNGEAGGRTWQRSKVQSRETRKVITNPQNPIQVFSLKDSSLFAYTCCVLCLAVQLKIRPGAPELKLPQSDPTLLCCAYKKQRLYLFTKREPADAEDAAVRLDMALTGGVWSSWFCFHFSTCAVWVDGG